MPIEQLAETIPNVPGWEKEGELVGSGQNAYTFNIGPDYDRVRIYSRIRDDNAFLTQLQVNGATTDYTTIFDDGQTTVNASAFETGQFHTQAFIDLIPDESNIFVSFNSGEDRIKNPSSGRVGTGAPINSFTVENPNQINPVDAVIFGLEL
jgi:hypothetical protein